MPGLLGNQCQPSYLASTSVGGNYSHSEELSHWNSDNNKINIRSVWGNSAQWPWLGRSRVQIVACGLKWTGPGHPWHCAGSLHAHAHAVTIQPYSVRRNILEMRSSRPCVKSSLTRVWPRILWSTSRMSNRWRTKVTVKTFKRNWPDLAGSPKWSSNSFYLSFHLPLFELHDP